MGQMQTALRSGKAPFTSVLRLGSAMLGKIDHEGNWQSVSISVNKLADLLGAGRTLDDSMADFTRFTQAIVLALAKARPAGLAPNPSEQVLALH